MAFKERIEKTLNGVNKRLFGLIESKKSNLCLAMDVESMDEALELADRYGPHIVALKLHVNHLKDFDYDKFSESMSKLKERHQFLVFEDSKFADIGSTNMKSYASGIFRIQNWADLVTAHVVPGPESIEGLKKSVNSPEPRACLLIAQMSSSGSVDAVDQSRRIAQMHPDYVAGFISQSRVLNDPGFVQFTPGVNVGVRGDGIGQQYVTPEEAIIERGADVIIVGRGIIKAEDPEAKLMEYKERGFNSYLKRLASASDQHSIITKYNNLSPAAFEEQFISMGYQAERFSSKEKFEISISNGEKIVVSPGQETVLLRTPLNDYYLRTQEGLIFAIDDIDTDQLDDLLTKKQSDPSPVHP